MKQISTGAGLLGLGVCMVATAFIATQRERNQAFAQTPASGNRVVGVGNVAPYRIFRMHEDGTVEVMNFSSDDSELHTWLPIHARK